MQPTRKKVLSAVRQHLSRSQEPPCQLLLDLSLLPEDLIFVILSHVPAGSLLKHCRLVCRKWREIVDSQALWKLKCDREGLLSRPAPEDWKLFYCGVNRNLIKNPCGEDEYEHWSVRNEGNGWNIEENHFEEKHYLILKTTSKKCFASSYGWCSKRQLIDLVAEGISQEFLDIYQPYICVYDWYSGRWDCGCVYEIHVTLLATDRTTVLAKFKEKPPEIPQWNDSAPHKVSHVFCNYGKGVRYVNFFHRGKDTKFWAGHYGARVTNSTVILKLHGS